MRIHAFLLLVAVTGSLLAAKTAEAQVDPAAINPQPGPQLPLPMPNGDPMPDPFPEPSSAPPPGGNPMPGAYPIPGTYPMPGMYPMPRMAPMPNQGAMPNQAPIPNAGPMPYPPSGPAPMSRQPLDLHGTPLPHGGSLSGEQMPPPGASPFVPPRIIHYGWPMLRIYRRDVPMPQPKPSPTSRETKFVHPRSSRLEIRSTTPARIYVDGEELDPIDGVYMVEPDRPLIPGVTYMHSVRVEGFDQQGREIGRTVVVYLRKGRVTELTFY